MNGKIMKRPKIVTPFVCGIETLESSLQKFSKEKYINSDEDPGRAGDGKEVMICSSA